MAKELKEEMTDERLDYLAHRFVVNMMQQRLKITFEDYLTGPERYDRIIGFADGQNQGTMVPRPILIKDGAVHAGC